MSTDDRQLLVDAFDSNWIAPLGPNVDGFEQKFAEKIGSEEAVALASGTSALHLALVLMNVGPGDEVITSSFTFAASANVITYVGATPVFIDSDPTSWNMDPQLLAQELETYHRRGRMPRAALVVDVNGQCADYDAIRKTCDNYEVPIVEDAAEALGATYRGRPAGRFGQIGIRFMPEIECGRSTRWLTALLVDPAQFGGIREDIRSALEAENIESRPLWKPMHMQPVFAQCRVRGGAVSELLFKRGLCLPSGSNLTEQDRQRVVDVVQSVAKTRVRLHQRMEDGGRKTEDVTEDGGRDGRRER